MKLKKVLATGVLAVTLLSTTIGVAAAPSGGASSVTMRDIFDAEYYASQYPDLREAFGNDEEKLYEHFITYGLKEGRNMSPILDVAAYRQAYEDLDNAFGDDWDKYVEHFFAYGAKEGREEGVLFNPVQYAEAYSDIAAAFGDDLTAIANHYMTFGMEERRQEGTSRGYDSIGALRAAERVQEQIRQAAANRVPVSSAPTQAPDTSVSSTPTQAPDTSVSPAPTQTPDTSVSPAPTQTPDTPVSPAPTQTPDTSVSPAPTETPDTPAVSDTERIYNAMIALKETYPEGMSWTDENQSYEWHALPGYSKVTGTGCAAFAFRLSDAAFGPTAEARKVEDVSGVRVGDIVRVNNDTHYVIVLSIAENGDITVAEGNYNDSVHWGRVIKKEELERTFTYLYTRYND